ncbi:MAG: hypothetical protein KAY59_07580, partial [Acidobacteria bacterium]|nr:hypothetical protein [Acidobacteriota bacterium]
MHFARWWLVAALVLASVAPAAAQDTLKVFLDCGDNCDFDFLRQEITYLNYVRDRKDADIHVLVTTQNTGTGGREYVIQYIGVGRFSDHTHRSVFISNGTDTSDERRRGFARVFTLGLTPYLMDTHTVDRLRLQFTPPTTAAPTTAMAATDKWNLWIFRVGASTDLRGERSDTSRQVKGNFSASRTTEKW